MRRTDSRRAMRMGDAIMRELADVLATQAQDPSLSLVTISGVRVNADLRVAEVLYTGGDDECMAEAAKGLERALPLFRRELAARLDTKHVPELRFLRDTFLEEQVYVGQRQSPTDS
ncbi:MAG: 30S ribosome-binding factor RbfA [Desulfovibrio sp.]|nr:MAG: 30S ribosome-binding factor RbfA [Desulfovibrio sp.]